LKVSFERLTEPSMMLAAMRTTQGKDMFKKKDPELETYYKMLLSEHSTSRVMKYRVYIEDIPYYVSTHLVRHSIGVDHYVLSQRDDDGTMEITERDSYPQGKLLNMVMDLNAQAMISIARKRLCHNAHKTAQDVIKKLKCSLRYDGDEYDRVLGNLLMRPCSWFMGYCSEPKGCGRVPGVKKLSDIHMKALEVPDE